MTDSSNQTDAIFGKPHAQVVVSALIREMAELSGATACLSLSTSDYDVFGKTETRRRALTGSDWCQRLSKSDMFSLVLGDFPLAVNKVEYSLDERTIRFRSNWISIFEALTHLAHHGLAIFLVEPTCFSGNEGAKFERFLNGEGFYVRAVLGAPDGLLTPETRMTPSLVVIGRERYDTLFVAQLSDDAQSREVARNLLAHVDTGTLNRGLLVEQGAFYSFKRLQIKQQIKRLETQYKEYETFSLKEIALQIINVRAGGLLEERNNSVYIPRIGMSQVVTKLSQLSLKHHNYFQVVLRDSVINEYAAAFFRSDLGYLVRRSLFSGLFIENITKRELEAAFIAVPSLNVQKQILLAEMKLVSLKDAIERFQGELALNPASSESISTQLDGMLESIGELSDADEILSLIRQGESGTVEFKESFSLDVRKQTKEKYVEKSALKTIVAFLNTEGGVLLIGVSDEGDLKGISSEIDKFHKASADKFLLHFKNSVKTKIGEEFYPYFEYQLVKVTGKTILKVCCLKSAVPCYLDDAEFFVRTNPATDQLEGPKLVQYVKNHFKQWD